MNDHPSMRPPICGPLPPPDPYVPPPASRSRARALWRGLRGLCPRCGVGPVLAGYLDVARDCNHCREPLGHIRADDGPAYFTILIAGHVAVPATLWVEQAWAPPLIPHMLAALALTGLLIWRLLPAMKGAMIGLMWALGLKGDEVQGE